MSGKKSTQTSSTIEEEAKHCKLPIIVAVSCAAVLEDAIDELIIMGKFGVSGQVTAEYEYQSPEERCNAYIPETQLYDRETIAPYEEAMLRERYVKFQRDRSYIEKALSQTMLSLLQDSDFTCLKDQVDQHYADLMFEDEVFRSNDLNQEEFNNLEYLLEQERKENESKLQVLSETVGNLKDELEDLTMENKIKLNYVKKWEETRLEQNDLKLESAEKVLTTMMDTIKNDIDKEMRINSEVESFILEIQQEHTYQIQQWMERYDTEIELRDTEIQILKEKREDQFNRIQELSELFEKHQQEINEYLAAKDNERLEYEDMELKNKMAIKIQAWWRGTMVRRHLGPYKVKKGQSSKGKRKGKK